MRQVPSRGFTLIELMISITLSLLVLTGVLGAYLAGSRANQSMMRRVEIQQDARFALSGLTREIRMAGTFGCALPNPATGSLPLNDYFPASGSSKWQHFASQTIGIRQESASGSAWLAGSGADFTPSGNVLIIQYGTGNTDVRPVMDASGTKINSFSTTLSSERPQIASAAVLALTNCQRLVFYPNTGRLAGNQFTLSPNGGLPLTNTDMNTRWELMRLVTLVYAVGTYQDQQGLYLFELDEDGQWQGPKQIAAGVTDLNILFGLQQCKPGTTEDANTQYFSAGQLSDEDWRKVGMLRLTLNLQRNVDVAGASSTIQRSYSTTVVLRRENLCMLQSAS